MKNLKPYAKALGPYWLARRINAQLKYRGAAAAIEGPAPRLADEAPVVLLFTSMGIFGDHGVVDALLARALGAQGARAIIVLCDGILPACHVSDRYAFAGAATPAARRRRQQRLCSNCRASSAPLEASGLTIVRLSEGLALADQLGLEVPDIDLSDEVQSGVIRFAASSHPSVLDALPADIPAAYGEAATHARRAIAGLLHHYRPSRVIAHHGIYLPQGVVQKLARQVGATFYSWHFGYRKSTLIFSRGDTYHRELTQPQPSAFEQPLAEPDAERISAYLQSRTTGGQDWIHFNRTPRPFSPESGGRPYFVFYTSVDWDAALHFPSSVFRSQFECLAGLIDIFRRHPDRELIIRVHPAEVTGFHPAALSLEDHLASIDLPPNVRVVGATDTTSSYDLARNCLAAIVYNTKLGIELPPFGIPTIVTGDSWIRDKGFSFDVRSLADLEELVSGRTALSVTPEQRERALQFAHYFYYRRCVPTPELLSSGPKFQIRADRAQFRKGQQEGTGMAFIAHCILEGTNVEMPA